MKTLSIIRLIFLISVTVYFIYVSRKALFNLKTHGFYRFFIFEACLILVLINVPYWFLNPFLPLQIISWALLVISLYLLYQSISFLRKIGGSKEREQASANYKFENTANLVKVGIYKYIRHPMYGSLLFLSLGAFLKDISVYSIILTATAVLFIILTAKTEEKENINFFGPSYSEYMKATKMFIPYIF